MLIIVHKGCVSLESRKCWGVKRNKPAAIKWKYAKNQSHKFLKAFWAKNKHLFYLDLDDYVASGQPKKYLVETEDEVEKDSPQGGSIIL